MPVINVNGTSLLVSGRLIRVGEIYDECWLEKESVGNPEQIINSIRDSRIQIDIFSFSQKLSETTSKYNYYMEWDNVAAIPITTFNEWWTRLPQATRKNVRRSVKRGVHVEVTEFNDEFVKGIVNIYNETPTRQGRRFWHYGKDFDTVKMINSNYLANCDFIGAYLKDELIGFLKLVYIGEEARIMQIISMVKHQDKRPTNALIAKAVEISGKRQMKYFIYGKYIYGKKTNSPIIEFKNRNGFEMVNIPKYYIPLNTKGKIFLKLKLHHGINGLIPGKIINYIVTLRAKWYEITMEERS